MSIFDNLDLSAVGQSGGLNPFSFMQTPTSYGAAPPPAALAPEPEAPPEAPGGLLDGVHGLPPPEPPADLPTRPQGFLQRLMAPSPDGLTFQDKLFAAGGILKGDSDSASKYLTGRRAELAKGKLEQQKLDDTAEKRMKAEAAARVMAASFDPVTKVFDFAKYAQGMAALGATPDDKVLAATYSSSIPKNQLANGPRGGLDVIDVNHPENGPIWSREPAPEKPSQSLITTDENGNLKINDLVIEARKQDANNKAAATAAHRRPLVGALGGAVAKRMTDKELIEGLRRRQAKGGQ